MAAHDHNYNPLAGGKPRKFFNDSGNEDIKIQYDSGLFAESEFADVIRDARRKLQEDK